MYDDADLEVARMLSEYLVEEPVHFSGAATTGTIASFFYFHNPNHMCVHACIAVCTDRTERQSSRAVTSSYGMIDRARSTRKCFLMMLRCRS